MKTRQLTQTALLVSAALLSSNAIAAGFQISEHSGSGLGRAFAGEAAIADNASTIAANPAGMALLDGPSLSNGITVIDPNIEVDFWKVDGAGYITDPVSADSAAPIAFVPNLYYTRPITDELSWGFGSYADFGLASEYSDSVNEKYGEIAGDTAVTVINLNNSISYEVTDQLALGASVSLLLADAELNRYSELAENFSPDGSDLLAGMSGRGIGFGWKVGALYQLNENHRFGFAYTAASDIDMSGEFTGVQLNTDDGLFDYEVGIDGELTLNLPSIMELSGYHQLTPKLAMHYSWEHIGWSTFKEILATSPNGECSNAGQNDNECMRKAENWQDSNRYSIGTTYQLNDQLTLRAGFAYDETPTDEIVTASIPDSDRMWYSTGATYVHGKHAIDFGFTYITGKTGDVHEEEGSYFSVTKSTALLYGIQYSMTFL